MVYAGHDDQVNDEKFTIKGTSTEGGDGKYKGEYQIHVKWKSSEVLKEPVDKKGLVYNKELQQLVAPGEAKNGEMRYALGTKTEPTGDFTAAVPTAKNAGNYYVWYMVEGDAGYVSTPPQCLDRAVSIAPMKIRLIVEDMTIKVGETGVISPKPDVDGLDANMPVKLL